MSENIKEYHHLTHLKKSHLASGSSALPSPLRQHQNSLPVFGPFLVTFRLTASSLCLVHAGAGGGGRNIDPHAAFALLLSTSPTLSGLLIRASLLSFDTSEVDTGVGVLGFCATKKLVIFCFDSILGFFAGIVWSDLDSIIGLSVLVKKFDSFTCFPENSLKYFVQFGGVLRSVEEY